MLNSCSVKMLEEELAKVSRLKMLSKTMQKPDNFTYIDVLNMHRCFDLLENIIKTALKEKTNSWGFSNVIL